MSNMRDPNLTFIVNAIKAVGGKMPTALSTAIDDQQRITAKVREVRQEAQGYGALAAAWANAVLDERDPYEDRDVFRAVLSTALATGDIEYAAVVAVNQRAVTDVKKIHGDILKTFKKAFDQAGRTLKNAHDILGNTNLEDTTTIFQLGPVAVQAHQEAQEARRLVRVIDRGWLGLNALTSFAGTNDAEHVTRWTDSNIDTWEKVRRLNDGWQMTVAGCDLNLAIDADTIRERIERLAREREERAARHDAEARPKRVNYVTGVVH